MNLPSSVIHMVVHITSVSFASLFICFQYNQKPKPQTEEAAAEEEAIVHDENEWGETLYHLILLSNYVSAGVSHHRFIRNSDPQICRY